MSFHIVIHLIFTILQALDDLLRLKTNYEFNKYVIIHCTGLHNWLGTYFVLSRSHISYVYRHALIMLADRL